MIWLECLGAIVAVGVLFAVKGVRVGTFYLLIVLLILAPLVAFLLLDRANARLATVIAVSAGIGLLTIGGLIFYFAWGARRMMHVESQFGFDQPFDAAGTSGRLLARRWLYRKIRLSGKAAAVVEFEFKMEHDPTERKFGDVFIRVNDETVLTEPVRGWFRRTHQFVVPDRRDQVPAELEIRVRWPWISLKAVRLKVEGKTVYREGRWPDERPGERFGF